MPVDDPSAAASSLDTATTPFASATLRQLARRVLAQRAGKAHGVESLTLAANTAYEDLIRVSAPVIGQAGVNALIGRAGHLVRREFPWLTPVAVHDQPEGSFAQVIASLQKQDVAVATDAAASIFATFAGLLVTFIGESLTARLLARAWPDAFPT